jgi:hypothetical protein
MFLAAPTPLAFSRVELVSKFLSLVRKPVGCEERCGEVLQLARRRIQEAGLKV